MSKLAELKARIEAGKAGAVNVLGVPLLIRKSWGQYRDRDAIREWEEDMKNVFHVEHVRLRR